MPHRQNGLCWSKARSKGWVRGKQQSRVESQREHLDGRAWEMGGVGTVTPPTLPVVPLILQHQQPTWLCPQLCRTQPSWETLNGA